MKEEGDFVGFGREWVIETKRIEGRNTLRKQILSELTKKPTANKKKDRPRVPTVTKPKKGKDKYYQENWDFNDIFEEIQLGITKSDDIRNRRLITDWLWRQYSKLSATQSNKPKKDRLKELKKEFDSTFRYKKIRSYTPVNLTQSEYELEMDYIWKWVITNFKPKESQ